MDRTQQGVGGGGEDAAGLEFAAIGTDPVVPQAAQPEGSAVLAADPVGLLLPFWAMAFPFRRRPLFVEAIGRQQAAVLAPGTTKERLLAHRLAAGIDRPALAAGVLQPARHEAPLGVAHLQSALLLPLDQKRFARPHLLPGLVLLEETLRQRTLEPWQQLIDRGGERVAATHQRRLWIRLGCSQSAWPDYWLRGFAGSESEGTKPTLETAALRWIGLPY